MATELKQEFKYVRGRCAIVPYAGESAAAAWEMPATIYDRLLTEDLMKIVFHESETIPTFPEFVGEVAGLGRYLLAFCEVDGNGNPVNISGFAWLSEYKTCGGGMTRAIGNFGFFKAYQSPEWTTPMGRLCLDFWFKELRLNTLLGITPEPNRAALAYIHRLGLKVVGQIPSYTMYARKTCDAIVTAMTMEQYFQRQEQGA